MQGWKVLTFFRFGLTLMLLLGLVGAVSLADQLPAGGVAPSATGDVFFPVLYKGYMGWDSTFSVRNVSANPAMVTVTFYDEFGTPSTPPLPGFGSNPFSLAGGASQMFSMASIGMAGGRYSAVVSSDPPVGAMAWIQRGVGTGNESHGMYLAASPPTETGAYLPGVAKGYNGYTSVLAIQNLSGTQMDLVQVDFYDANGSQVGQESNYLVPPYTTWHLDLSMAALPPNWTGSAIVSGSSGGTPGPLAVVDNQLGGSLLRTHSGFPAGASPLYLPSLLDNYATWTTSLTVQNTGNSGTVVTVHYSDGQPDSMESINARGSHTFEYNIGAHAAPFAATITADQPLAAIVALQTTSGKGLTYEAFTASASDYYFPLLMKTFGTGFSSGISVYNPGSTQALVTITYEGYEGNAYNIPVPGGQFGSISVVNEGFLPAGWSGSASLSSDQPIVAYTTAFNMTVGGDGQAGYQGYVPSGVQVSVSMAKSAEPAVLKPGDAVTYTLAFDVGDAATTAVITDLLPDELDAYAYSASAGLILTETGGADYTWDAYVPAEGGSITITGVLTGVVADTTVSNEASIWAGGSSAQDSAYVIVDVTPPDTTITNAPPDPDNDPTPAFYFTGDDGTGSGIAGFECQVDSGGWAACTSPHTTASLGEGPHTFEVRAIDNVGYADPSPASLTWTIDLTPPALSPVLVSPADGSTITNTRTVTLTWLPVADPDVAGYMVDLNGSGSAVGNFTETVIGPLTSGTYTWTVAAYDAAGNSGPYTTSWTFDLDTGAFYVYLPIVAKNP